MGCLLELFFEIFVEGIFELVGYCYIKLMQLIVPDKTISEKAKKAAKRVTTVIAAVLFLVLIVGVIVLAQEDPVVKTVGRYMTYIPLTLIGLQIVLGIIMRVVSHFKK